MNRADIMERWKTEFRTFLKYGIVGGLNALVFSGAAWVLSRTGMHYSLYTGAAYLIAFGFSYWMNSVYTFRHRTAGGWKRAVRFFGVCLGLLGLAELVQWVLIDRLGVRILWGIIAGMVVYSGIGYLVNRIWVFGSGTETAAVNR